MSIDTRFISNPLPYNIVDKNDYNNRGGLKPSYQYKNKKLIWLNSYYATSTVNNGGTTYYEFSFDVPQFQLYNQTILRVVSFTSNEATAKPLYLKIKNLMFDNSSSWCNDNEGFPLIFVNHTAVAGMLVNNNISLTLLPQSINNITLKINDSFISKDTGFTISGGGAGHFIIGLLFEDADLVSDNIVSQYK